jgi:serine/threonine protein kinase
MRCTAAVCLLTGSGTCNCRSCIKAQMSRALSVELPPDALSAPVTDKYALEGVIGQGSYGVVHAARRLDDGTAVVIKQIHIDSLSPSEQESTVQEAHTLSGFQHANIIKYHGACYDDGTPCGAQLSGTAGVP